MSKSIELYGVETHNLRNIDAKFPHRKLTVVTGVSGSGKSSLAFNTLYAEGQRRFLESVSTYTRQFLDQMPKPPIRHLENILPAIALRQQSSFAHPRSTVATVTELMDFLGLFYASHGSQKCIQCGSDVCSANNITIAKELNALSSVNRLKLVVLTEHKIHPDERPHFLQKLVQRGYLRLWENGGVLNLESTPIEALLDAPHYVVLIDRLIHVPGETLSHRLVEAIEEAFLLGDGKLRIDIVAENTTTLRFDKTFACTKCHKQHNILRAELFNPNSTLGACSTCMGFGRVSSIDWEKVIPDSRLSLREHAIKPLSTPAKRARENKLLDWCQRNNIDINLPWKKLPPKDQEFVKFGNASNHGVTGFFEDLETRKQKLSNRMILACYRGYTPCPDCESSGIARQTRHVYYQGKTLPELLGMNIDQVLDFLNSTKNELGEKFEDKTQYYYNEIHNRLQTLHDVGLGYLTLDRQTKTLSGGELQRLHLSTGLGRGLTDTLYVLDEPTAGLHARDSLQLIRVIEALRDMGNTVVVVEHDQDVIAHGDYIIELGPGGGERGGSIVFEGTFKQLFDQDTATAHMFNQKLPLLLSNNSSKTSKSIKITHASLHNIENLDVTIPLGKLVCITGVSGSGKSTLINNILYETWKKNHVIDHVIDFGEVFAENEVYDEDELEDSTNEVGISLAEKSIARVVDIQGFQNISDIVLMEQGSLGRSTRANAATMTKAYDSIRKLMSETEIAKLHGIDASMFSFNMAAGRCPRCEGHGFETIDMQFLSDITTVCPACQGKRFQPEVLQVTWHNKNIDDILNLTVEEAIEFFKEIPLITRKLLPLLDVGLGYIRIGQETSTLSGGEFQRLRLSTFLTTHRKATTLPRLFIFDEPTTGLHAQDVQQLLLAMRKLVEAHESVIVVEHHLFFIAGADYIIDMGPDAGPNGGKINFEGPPEKLLHTGLGFTADALRSFYYGNTSS